MSLRFMWDAKGLGFAEALVPTTESPNLQACMTATQLVNCTSAIPQGWPLASDSFTWSTGTPMSVSMRIRLNDPKIANGEMQYWVNGVSMADVQGLVLRDTAASRFRGMHMQTYFGGASYHTAFASQNGRAHCDSLQETPLIMPSRRIKRHPSVTSQSQSPSSCDAACAYS